MDKNLQIVQAVYAAKEDNQKADDLIRKYIPFIRAEASKFMSRICTESDDEFSIAIREELEKFPEAKFYVATDDIKVPVIIPVTHFRNA